MRVLRVSGIGEAADVVAREKGLGDEAEGWSFALLSAIIMGFMRTLFSAIRALILGIVIAGSFLASGAVEAATCPGPDYPQQCPGALLYPSAPGCIAANDLCILEPLPVPGGTALNAIPADKINNLGAFTTYINGGLWKWVFGIGVAVAVLNGVEAGAMIVLSNGDSGKIEGGKTRFFWSIVGLILLLLSGVLLNAINPFGFVNIT